MGSASSVLGLSAKQKAAALPEHWPALRLFGVGGARRGRPGREEGGSCLGGGSDGRSLCCQILKPLPSRVAQQSLLLNTVPLQRWVRS